MRSAVRWLTSGIVILFLLGLARQFPWAAGGQRAVTPATASPHSLGDAPESPPETTITADAARDLPSAEEHSEDAARRDLGSPFVRSLSRVVDQNSQVFGDAGDDLQQTLARADQILIESRTSARQALREVNRQVRLPGRSPHLIVFVVAGLSTTDLHCYSAGAPSTGSTPTCDQLARTGLQAMAFDPTHPTAQRTSPEAGPQRLASLLWHSGYTTAWLGDLSHEDELRSPEYHWELQFGWARGRQPSVPEFAVHPSGVRSQGRLLRLTATPPATTTSFSQLLTDEVRSFRNAQRTHRPLALFVVTPLSWWTESVSQAASGDDPLSRRAAAVSEFDAFADQLVADCEQGAGAARWVTLVLGVSPENTPATTPTTESGPAPLLVRYPGRIPPGTRFTRPIGWDDLQATLADMLQCRSRADTSAGRSRWSEWRTAGSRVE